MHILFSLFPFWGCQETTPASVKPVDFNHTQDGEIGNLEIRDMQVPSLDQAIEQPTDSLVDFDLPPNQEAALDSNFGEGIFSAGCPKAGFAHARTLQGPSQIKRRSSYW